MVLAETLRTLSFCKHQRRGFFTASMGLLQIWLISHLTKGHYPVHHFMHCNISTPLGKLSLPIQGKQDWHRYLAQLQGQDIQWYLGWCSFLSIRVQTSELPFIPLIGLSNVTPYAPGRSLRQFKRLQHIPRMGDMSFFCFDFTSSFSKERYPEALRQWHSIILDNKASKDCIVDLDPEYIK